jgi:hypothetical protein
MRYHSTKETFKVSPFLTETLMDPNTSHTDDNTQTAFNRAYNTTDDFWTWLGRPENEPSNDKFVIAMDAGSKMEQKDNVLRGTWPLITDYIP